jgi:hypothetical protein
MLMKICDMKKCSKCNKIKDFSDFKRDNSKSDGFYSSCKLCVKEYRANHYSENKELYRQKNSKFYAENKEHIKSRVKKYHFNRIKNDDVYKLKVSLRNQVYKAFKKNNWIKDSPNAKLLGCSFDYAKKHLELQFSDGMSWSNYGEWHIDHIIPLASAKTKIEIEKLFHYTNLQPLWAKDNLKKGCKIEENKEQI